MSNYKLVGRKIVGGQEVLVDPSTIGAANVLLTNVDCLSSVYEGAVVRMNASGVAVNAIATSLENSNIIGIVESKSGNILCDIRVLGVTEGIFIGLDVTKEYFLSDSFGGGITTTPPTASGSVLLRIGQPFSATQMMVLKGLRTVRL